MIVLTILKVIGGIFLLFLLLILMLLAVILFVPIRYASEGYKGEELTDYRIDFSADWLLKILRFKAVYTDNGLELLLKLFWITLMKSPEEENHEKTEALEETELREDEPGEETEALKETDSREDELSEDEVTTEETSEQTKEQEPDILPEQRPEEKTDDRKSNTRHIIEKTLLDKIKEQFAAFLGKIKNVAENINKIREQINDPENQLAVSLLIKNVRYLIQHYKFRVLKGHFVYGSEDPAIVGQVMIFLSILHPVYGRSIQIEPVFDRSVMKGDMYFKGHIRLIHLLISVIELLLNKKIRLVVVNHFKGDTDG